ncbi:protein kinase [Streptomyces sp. NPDC056405]|uniref:serine/threonine-protein kinase n=1 Tax=Streptomyces sp. NPDC056405 TaxID=3345811 RepID=UPI0035DD299A
MGEVFAGRYELVDPIGRGGVGAVWRAWDHRRRRYVAAKVLQQRDAHSLLRFVREQAMRIDHPHVLAPASWAADDDKVLFTMDLVTGGSLVHLIGDYGPLPPAFVCTLLDQLLAGLAAVHAEDVVHRDIKPANLLLEATGTGRPRLRLSDFGIAMRLGEPRLTETNLVVGTPGYLAPEQMMGAEPDFPADLFAVGLVALYLLEGAKPDAKALVQYFAEHGTPPAPQGIPEPLWQVVATLVQPDPPARFRTATGARKALAAAAELLPEPGPDDELIEIFDQVGPLPTGFGPDGPLRQVSGVDDAPPDPRRPLGRPEASPDATPSTLGRTPSTLGGTPAIPDGTAAPDHTPPTPDGTAAPAETPPHLDHTPPAPDGTPASHNATPPTPDGTPAPHNATPPTPDGTPAPHNATPPTPDGTPAPHNATPPTPDGTPAPLDWLPPATDHTPPASPPGPVGPSAMSETGSFHLPPPQPTVTSSPAPGLPQATATPSPAPGPPQTHAQTPDFPGSPQYRHPYAPPLPAQALAPTPQQRADVPTASYTAQSPRSRPPAQASPQHRASRRRRRPGPPARVAVPLLLLALACYAVGFWALTRI